MNDSCFSSVICEICNSKLTEFLDFKSELIENQKKMLEYKEQTSSTINKMEINYGIEEESNAQSNIKSTSEEYQIEALEESLVFDEKPKKKPQDFGSKKQEKTRKMCQICGLSFASNGLYHHLLRQHTSDPRFVCDFCGKGFRVKHDIREHLKIHQSRESREKFRCEFCSSEFLSKSAVKNHEHIFHSDVVEEHLCLVTDCGKIFSSRMKLFQHRSTVHSKGHFACSQCDKFYSGKNALQKHIIKNHGEKTPCKICGKLFAPGMFLNRHLKCHGPPEFLCTFENCRKEFHSRSALGYHIESTHKDPQEVLYCTTCQAPYNSIRNLNRHIQRQHNNVRVQCKVEGCFHTSSRKDYLAAHYRSHKNIDKETKNALLEKVKEIKLIPW